MSRIGWLAVILLLTLVFYLPVWFVFGWLMHDEPHPDYWTLATPANIIPISGLLALSVAALIRRAVNKQ